MKVGEWAMLRLHKGYSLPSTVGITKKLTQQYVGPIFILERIGRLAYKLDITPDWRIYPVFSVVQLEPASPPTSDPFNRPHPTNPPPVFVDDDTNTLKSFEVERLPNKQTIRRERGLSVEYLVCLLGYGPDWDRWYNVKDLHNAKDLLNDYENELCRRQT